VRQASGNSHHLHHVLYPLLAQAVGVDHLVGQGQRVEQAIEMAGGRMNIDGLDRVAGRHVNAVEILGQFVEVLVTLPVAGPPATVKVRAIGRATHAGEQHSFPTHADFPGRVSRRNVELCRCFPHLFQDKVTIHPDVIAVRPDHASCFTQDVFRFLVEKLDTDFFEHPHGPIVNGVHCVLVERLCGCIGIAGQSPGCLFYGAC